MYGGLHMVGFITMLFVLFFSLSLMAQVDGENFDESKVPSYTLPDPLVFNDGSTVVNKEDWAERRQEIFTLFENNVYGISPEWGGNIEVSEVSRDNNAIDGLATRQEISLVLKNGDREMEMILLLYLPHSAKPSPVFIGCNFNGNHTISDEPDIMITSSWVFNNYGLSGNKATEMSRGKRISQWPIKEIISRGYGVATIYYGDIDPDYDDGFKNGVHGLYDQQRDSSSWGSISAWAWGLSRAMDYFETIPAIDANKVIVMGHSRLGATALWAGASDKRFAIVISNNAGGVLPEWKRKRFDESDEDHSLDGVAYWYCERYSHFAGRACELPVDAHELVALIAPRPVYMGTAEDDLYTFPKDVLISCIAGSPVYELLGMEGFPAKEMPEVNHPVIGPIGFHLRPGKHDVKLYDWQCYMDFADFHFK
jgi:hypothetical protein